MYCTANDIVNELTEGIAAQLTNSVEPDSDVIENVITDASDYIDTFLNSVYELPLTNTHTYLKLIAIEMTVYLMKKGRVANDKNDELKVRVDEKLNKIVSGEIDLRNETRISPFLVTVNNNSLITPKIWEGYDNF